MKKSILLALSFLSLNAFASFYTGAYTTEGTCKNGSSNLQVLTAETWLGSVASGPSNDGEGGCEFANRILNCPSQTGKFEYAFLRAGGFKMKTPVVLNFECL